MVDMYNRGLTQYSRQSNRELAVCPQRPTVLVYSVRSAHEFNLGHLGLEAEVMTTSTITSHVDECMHMHIIGGDKISHVSLLNHR